MKPRFECFAWALVVSILCLLPRIQGYDFVNNAMWAEDGNVFINQSFELGFRALWESYAGYLHIYPRIMALLSSFLDLSLTPYVFFAGWIVAFYAMAVSLLYWARRAYRLPLIAGLMMVFFIGLQPHSGETFFAITNAQWFLGVALAIHMISGVSEKTGWVELLFVVVLCLTGPFSLILTPVLLLQYFVFKERKSALPVTILFFLCVLTQLWFVLHGDRLASAVLDKNLSHWCQFARTFFTFGGGIWVTVLSCAFWSALLYCFYRSIQTIDIDETDRRRRNHAILVLSFGLAISIAQLLTFTGDISCLSPLGGGSRYFVIPYSMLVIAAVLISANRSRAKLILGISFLLICVLQFAPVHRNQLNFQAYVEWARHKKDLVIPINPKWPSYPGWFIEASRKSNWKVTNIKPEQVSLEKLQAENDKSILRLKLNEPIGSEKDRYLGINLILQKEHQGGVKFYWREPNSQYNEYDSLFRFYPSGNVSVQFAAPCSSEGIFVRFDLLDTTGRVNVQRLDVYHLPDNKSYGLTK